MSLPMMSRCRLNRFKLCFGTLLFNEKPINMIKIHTFKILDY